VNNDNVGLSIKLRRYSNAAVDIVLRFADMQNV